MSKGLSTEPYKGVRDFYPQDWARLSAVFAKVRETLTSLGYQEYQASPLEPSELYESKGNEEIIREQTFSFEDRGGRRVTLRPEMTPTLARMVAGRRRELVYPLRWFSIGNRFRYERPQRGRLREFFQTDVDLVGLPEGEADVEILTLAARVLKAFGATDADFSMRVNSRKLLRLACTAAGLPEGEQSRAYWQLIDRKAKMSAAEFEMERALFSADPLKVIERGSDPEVAAEKARLEALIARLRSEGMKNVSFDADIVRGFDYYTGVVFEVNDTNPANPRALFGGGRYDELVALFGGDPIPAVGFAFGDVTLLDFLETHDLLPQATVAPQVYVGTPEPSDIPLAREFQARYLIEARSSIVGISGKPLADQLREAVKRGAEYFIAYGKKEQDTGRVRVKTLATGTETEMDVGALAHSLLRR